MSRFVTAAAISALALSATAAGATQINTGGADGAYNRTFCPPLAAELGKAKLDYKCAPSAGTKENMQRVAADPRQIGFGQLDVMALEAEKMGGISQFTTLRSGDVRECLFAVTKNKTITNFGELAVQSAKLRFILPPEQSGSVGSFNFLRQIDSEGLGTAKQITYAPSTDDAIKQALAAEDTVTMFVQFPDPDNPRFKLIQDLGGHIVPVLDRTVLRQQIGGEKVYFPQETQVANATWLKAGQTVVTACTPMVVFTGVTDKIAADKDKQDHRDVIATIKALDEEVLLPKEGLFSRVWKRTKELSAQSAEQLTTYSEQAREQAKPMLERAKEATSKAMEAARPTLEKAKEMGAQAYEKAKQEVKELMDKAQQPAQAPTTPPAPATPPKQ
jgi:hypothetical protein